MKQPVENSEQEVLAGLVERVTFHSLESGFCVLAPESAWPQGTCHDNRTCGYDFRGEWVTASGDWVNDRTHGLQFRTRFLKTSAPTSLDGIEKYLGSGMIRGIGPVYAKRMVKMFGKDVFDSDRGRARAIAGGRGHRAEEGRQDHLRMGRSESHPRDHGVSPQPCGRNRPGGPHLQDLWRRCCAGDE